MLNEGIKKNGIGARNPNELYNNSFENILLKLKLFKVNFSIRYFYGITSNRKFSNTNQILIRVP